MSDILFFNRFPFDTDNPIGYLSAVILEYAMSAYEFFLVACTLALGIGEYCFAISASAQMQRFLSKMNDLARVNENQSNEIKLTFTQFIDAHGFVKQLSIMSIKG